MQIVMDPERELTETADALGVLVMTIWCEYR